MRAFRYTGDMMKRPTVELDALDWKLIALLQEDARLTNREIAARVESSEPTVRRRIDRLVRTGVIRIAAVVSPFALGYEVVAIIGLQIGALLAGAVLTERVFSIRGIGDALARGFEQKDYPVLQVLIMMAALIYIVVNLLVDIAYAVIDPRVRAK